MNLSELPEEYDPNHASVFKNKESALNHEPDLSLNSEAFTDPAGRIFHQIKTHRFGADQMMVTKMLKGIIPVSDVVYVGNKGKGAFYSHQISMENIKPQIENPYTLGQAKIDNFILTEVFCDNDHAVIQNPGRLSNFRSEHGTFAFFDFHKVNKFWNPPSGYHEGFIKYFLSQLDEPETQFLSERLTELLDRFEGEKGSEFLDAILELIKNQSEETPSVIEDVEGDDKIERFRREVTRRLKLIQGLIQ